jgi:hypothetical protein
MSQFPGGPSPYGPSPFDGGQAYRPMPRSPSKGGTRPMPQMPGGGMPMPGGPGKGGRGRISRGGGKGGRRPQGPMPMPIPQNPLGMGGGMGQPMPHNPLGMGGGMGQPMPNYKPDVMPPMSGGMINNQDLGAQERAIQERARLGLNQPMDERGLRYPPAIPPMSGGYPGQITADGPVRGAPYMQNIMQGRLGNNMRSGSFSGGMQRSPWESSRRYQYGGMFGGGGGGFGMQGLNQMQQPMGGGFGMQGLNQMQQPMGGFSAGGITDLYPL